MFASSWEMQVEAAAAGTDNGDGSNSDSHRRQKHHAPTCPRHAQNANTKLSSPGTSQQQQSSSSQRTTSNSATNHQSATAGGRSNGGGFSLRHFLDSIFSSQHQTAPSKEEAEAQQLRKLLADYEQFHGCEMEMREQSNVVPIMWDVGTLDRLVLGREQIQKNFKLSQLKIDASLTLELDPSMATQSRCLIHTAAEQGIHCDSNYSSEKTTPISPSTLRANSEDLVTKPRKRGRGVADSSIFSDENNIASAAPSTSSLTATNNNSSPRPYAASTMPNTQPHPDNIKTDLSEKQIDSDTVETHGAITVDTTLDIPVTLTIGVTPTTDRHHNPSRRGRPYVKAMIIRLLKGDEKVSSDSETYREALHHLRLQSAAIEESEKERMPAMLNPENASHSMSSNMVMFTLPYRLPHALANPLRLPNTATNSPQVFQSSSSSNETIRHEKRQKLSLTPSTLSCATGGSAGSSGSLSVKQFDSGYFDADPPAVTEPPATLKALNSNTEQQLPNRSVRILIMCQVNDVFKLRCLVQHKRLQTGHWRSLLIDRLTKFSIETQEQQSHHNTFTTSLTKKALLKCIDGERLVDLSHLVLIVPALKYVSVPSAVPDAVCNVFTRLFNTCGTEDIAGTSSSTSCDNTAYCSDTSVAAMFRCKWHVQLVDLLLKLRCQNEHERTGVGALVDRLSYTQLIDALLQYMEVVRVELVQRLVEKVGDRWLRDSSCLLLDAIDAIQPGDKRRAICRIFQPYAEFLSVLQEHETHTMMDNKQLQVLQELIAASH